MAVAERTRTVTVNLEGDCHDHNGRVLAARMHEKLGTPNYSQGVSVLLMPGSLSEWRVAHRTARKRADRASRLGYTFAEIDRSVLNDDIHEINTSKQERQGRPMSSGYLNRHNHGPLPNYPCDRHRIHTYGILQDDRLRAYLSLYRIGDLGLVSMILGHGDHLANDIMYLLAAGLIDVQAEQGGVLYYNRWDSGTDGLRYYKERVGFRPVDIEWVL